MRYQQIIESQERLAGRLMRLREAGLVPWITIEFDSDRARLLALCQDGATTMKLTSWVHLYHMEHVLTGIAIGKGWTEQPVGDSALLAENELVPQAP